MQLILLVIVQEPGSRDELSQARYNFDWSKQFELSLDPERAKVHDETLPADIYKQAEFAQCVEPSIARCRQRSRKKNLIN